MSAWCDVEGWSSSSAYNWCEKLEIRYVLYGWSHMEPPPTFFYLAFFSKRDAFTGSLVSFFFLKTQVWQTEVKSADGEKASMLKDGVQYHSKKKLRVSFLKNEEMTTHANKHKNWSLTTRCCLVPSPVFSYLSEYILTNTSARAGYDTRSILSGV